LNLSFGVVENYLFSSELKTATGTKDVTKVSEQIKRHFYLEILKIQIESVPIFQC
jgi:hypothetical protein